MSQGGQAPGGTAQTDAEFQVREADAEQAFSLLKAL